MQGRYGNVRASARSHFISPGLLRQQHAKRSYPNPNTSIAINNESSARKPATKAMGNVNHSKVANDDSEDERVDLAWKKWGVNMNRATSEPVDDSDHGSEFDSEYESEFDSEYESEYDSEHESEYSKDSFEDENMTAREKNLALKKARLLDMDRQPKKLKSMHQDAATRRRDDYEEARDSARPSDVENHRDATNTTENMTRRENNLSFTTARLLDKDMRTKKLKSMNQDVATNSRDDFEEGRDSARASNAENHMDATEKADRTEEKRGRGKNKCKKVAKLKPGEKIKVMFYNNRALCTSFARHIGRIIRDPTITPVRVKKWTDITETSLKHIFAAVEDKFENIDENIKIDVYKDDIMEHARDLWNNWRGDLSRHYVKPAKNMQQAIKNCPKDFPQADWEWLVKEHFFSKEFIARSKRNSINRSNLTILHHSGSKPYRKVIYDNGGKDRNPPTLDALFFMTHTKGGSFMDFESSSKHVQLEEEISSDPTVSNAQLMDKCFPSKRQDHIIGYGGGVKARHLRSSSISKAELMEKLKQSEDEKRAMQEENRELREENRATNSRVSRMEKEWEELKNKLSSN